MGKPVLRAGFFVWVTGTVRIAVNDLSDRGGNESLDLLPLFHFGTLGKG